jgi:hypothetical protein
MSGQTFTDLRVNNAEQFKESVSEPSPNTKIYMAFGKVDPWANEAVPEQANNSVSMYYEVWRNMIGGKRLFGSDFAHVIPRFDYVANSAYISYDHTNDMLHDGETPFYVVTASYDVYKCIGNNNGTLSEVEPTSFNTETPVQTADGYTWKYMYSISGSEQIRFTTDDYIPVKTLSIEDGSLQWEVQENASDGSIEYIEIINRGDGFTNVSNLVVTITGDGSAASATATIHANTALDRITIIDSGTSYTWAEVSISGGGGSGAEARAIISPPGGHGSNPLYELGGKNVMLDARLRYSEDGVLPVENDYRQIAILKDPYIAGTSNVASVPAFSQQLVLTTSGSGSFSQDEYVYQGASLETAVFKGRVVRFDTDTNKVYLINIEGTPNASRSLIGSESFTVRALASVTEGDLKKNSGRLMYVENILPVIRSSDQIENYKIVLKF